jgi:hypothetical protein
MRIGLNALALEVVGGSGGTAGIAHTGLGITRAAVNLVSADGIREIIRGAQLARAVVAHPCTASAWGDLERKTSVLDCCSQGKKEKHYREKA